MTTREELIASIVDNLKLSPHSRSDIAIIVTWQVDVLQAVIAGEPSFGRQAENNEYGSEIDPLVRRLKRKLAGMPDGTRRALLVFSAYAGQQIPRPENLDFALIERYERAVMSALDALEAGCAVLTNNRIGDYHTLDRTKHFCAATGFDLMVGLQAGQPTNGDPFRIITNLLFEIVAPDEVHDWRRRYKKDPDLRSHCEKVLSNWRNDQPYLKGHTDWLRSGFAEMIGQKSASSM